MPTLNINDSKTENWSVSRSITDALWTLTAQIDKHTTPAFFTKIKAVAKDHNDTDRTPFVGIFPGSDYTMAPVANKAALTGYDYAWYLTTQYVPATDRTTLIDTDPATTVTTLLGGAVNWATVTGVKPFRMIADVNWATIKKVFEFDEKCTRWQAIQEICEYCNYVFVVKPYYDGGDWYSYAYFVPEADIDNASPTGLDLPAMQTFTKPDAYLMSGTTVRDNPEKGYNRIKVTGYDEATDTYYYSTDGASNTYETAGVTAGTELAIEYFYASKDLDSQAKVTARATALLNYFQASSKVYIARLKRRLDLELYQKVRFADYDKIGGTTGVPVDMRITRISYHHAAVDDYVEIEFAKDQDAQQLKRLTEAVNPDYVSGTLKIMDNDLTNIGLVDIFNDPAADDGAGTYLPLAAGSGSPLTGDLYVGGNDIKNIVNIKGSLNADFSLWGSNDTDDDFIKFLEWDHADERLSTRAETFTLGHDSSDAVLSTAFLFYRGTTANVDAAMGWNETSDRFEFTIEHGVTLAQILCKDLKLISEPTNNRIGTIVVQDGTGDMELDAYGDIRIPNDNLDMNTTNKIINLAAGTVAGNAVRYEQVLLLAGGTMAGAINMDDNDITGVDDLVFNGTGSTIDNVETITLDNTGTRRIRLNGGYMDIVQHINFTEQSSNVGSEGSIFYKNNHFYGHAGAGVVQLDN